MKAYAELDQFEKHIRDGEIRRARSNAESFRFRIAVANKGWTQEDFDRAERMVQHWSAEVERLSK